MGDTHFLLRHAIVGAVFLIFAWLGWWLVADKIAWAFFTKEIATEGFAAISALVLAPLIGITIQGSHVVMLKWKHGEIFNDHARLLLKGVMKNVLIDCSSSTEVLSPQDWKRLLDAPADSLFVWLYHRSAPVDLIEWARRRRSYYYLGINLVIAVLFGTATGLFIAKAPPWIELIAASLAGILWCAGAISAALAMRDDVERMELLWIAARVDPTLRSCLEGAFGTVIHETAASALKRGRRPSAPAPTGAVREPAPK